jgi:hypothetical protein
MAALKVFNVDAGQDNHKTRLAIRDLLTNIAHLCDQSQLNLADILKAATNLYLEENPKGQQLTKDDGRAALRTIETALDAMLDNDDMQIDETTAKEIQRLSSYAHAGANTGQSEPYVLVTVVGGVAEVAINASGVGVDVLDYDNLKADHSLFKRLSDQERAFLAAHDADLYAQLEAESQVNSLEP